LAGGGGGEALAAFGRRPPTAGRAGRAGLAGRLLDSRRDGGGAVRRGGASRMAADVVRE